MTRTISFIIPGRITGKERARVYQGGDGSMKSYTPEKTRHAEALIRDLAAQQMKGLGVFEGPVEMFVNVWRIPPPSWPKKKREAANYIVGTPDSDNVLKLISDALQGTCYFNDYQVAVAHVQRRWNLKREEVYVLVRTLDAGSLQEPEPKDSGLRLVDAGSSQARTSPVVERNDRSGDRAAAAPAKPENGQRKGLP